MVALIIKNRNNSGVVLIDTFSYRAFWYAFFLALTCLVLKIPYIPILHGGKLVKTIKRRKMASKILFGKAELNTSPSKYLYRAFNDIGFDTIYIPNFIELEKYEFKYRSKVDPKILWVRSFHSIYNPLLAVKSLKYLVDRDIDATICMVGPISDSSYGEVCDYIEKNKLKKRVQFTGFLTKDEWIKLSINYDIFLNTSKYDNHPISLVEAMALGLPVVSTNVGGIPFLIEHLKTGILCGANNESLIEEKIIDLINDSDLTSKISSNARKSVEEFDWLKVKSKWRILLDQYTL